MWQQAFKKELKKLGFMSQPFNPDGNWEPRETDSSAAGDPTGSAQEPFVPYETKIRRLPTYAVKRRLGKLQTQMKQVSGRKDVYAKEDVNELHSKISPLVEELGYRGYQDD